MDPGFPVQSAFFVFQNLSLPNLHSRYFYSDFLVLRFVFIILINLGGLSSVLK